MSIGSFLVFVLTKGQENLRLLIRICCFVFEQLLEPISSMLKSEIQRQLHRLEGEMKTEDYDKRDYSVYTGTTGKNVVKEVEILFLD